MEFDCPGDTIIVAFELNETNAIAYYLKNREIHIKAVKNPIFNKLLYNTGKELFERLTEKLSRM